MFASFVKEPMHRWLRALPRRGVFALMWAGAALITVTSLSYFDFRTLPPFVIEKLPVRFELLWLTSLRAHVASALLSFPLCLTLMTRGLQRRPRAHRRLGRVTGVLVLFVLVPSGVVLAFDAKGGPLVTLGFLVSAGIVAVAMSLGVVAARRREHVRHARLMRHVVAQMSVAVSSRALILALDAVGASPELAYVLALWAPVVLSAGAAELVSRPVAPHFVRPLHVIQRIYREFFSPLVLVRVRARARSRARLGR